MTFPCPYRREHAMNRFRLLVLPLLLLLAACALTPAESPAAFTPLAPGMARIVFFREIGTYDPAAVLTVALNDKAVGTLPRGDAFYRDVTPGTYTITFSPTRSVPDQFKAITPGAGEVFYVKLIPRPDMVCAGTEGSGSGPCDISGFTSEVVDPALAQREMQTLSLVRG
jgi:hypothetical protein